MVRRFRVGLAAQLRRTYVPSWYNYIYPAERCPDVPVHPTRRRIVPYPGPCRSACPPRPSGRHPTLQEPSYAGDSTSRRSGSADWVLLQQLSYNSYRRNATTAESKTSDGQAVAVSFWLVDPPGVSYFTLLCPGIKEDDDDDHSYSHYEASVICAEGALVLFSVTFHSYWKNRLYQYFVYRAGPGKPSLDLLPDPDIRGFVAEEFGLLPAHNGHYAVAYLNWIPNAGGEPWQFDAHVFSSEMRAWTTGRASQSLSESDKLLLGNVDHETSKQITVGSDSLGWVDIIRGILLITNLFDDHPVIQYIPLPKPRVCTTDDDGGIFYCAAFPEYIRDVTCCDGLIKLVDIDIYGGDGGSDEGWTATTFTRMVSWDDWRRRFTVDVADISVDPRYRALLPELWNDKTKQLELNKKLAFYGPTLSTQDDDFVYMMARVNDEDDKACVITIDMRRAAVEAVAPFSAQGRRDITTYCPCAFPKHIDAAADDRPVALPSCSCGYSGIPCLLLLVSLLLNVCLIWRMFMC